MVARLVHLDKIWNESLDICHMSPPFVFLNLSCVSDYLKKAKSGSTIFKKYVVPEHYFPTALTLIRTDIIAVIISFRKHYLFT